MNKEFEALDFLKQQAIAFEHSELAIKVANENHTIVKQALTELKQIKEAKPSEALECLRSLDIQVRFIGILDVPSWEKYLPTIKQALLKAQEQDKVLEIIKNIIKFGDDLSAILNFNTYEEYDEWSWDYELTEEEFELLKRWSEK